MTAGERYFERHPLSRRQLSVFFVLASLVGSAWCVLLAVVEPAWYSASWRLRLTFLAMVSFTAMFAWAALGTAYEWPGFRPEPDPEEDEDGLYDDELDA